MRCVIISDSYIINNSYIKIKAKALLCGFNAKLFAVSAIGIILRAVLIIAVIPGVYLILRPSLAGALAGLFKKPLKAALIFFAAYLIRLAVLIIAAALRLGEQYTFFMRAAGEKPTFKQLFMFFSPRKAAAAFSLYGRLFFYRAAWLAVFLLPGALMFESALLVYFKSDPSAAVIAAFICGGAILSAVGLVFFGAARARFISAPLSFSSGSLKNPSLAVKKSISDCDCAVTAFMLFRASLAGWYALCLSGIGLFYALPYIKLANAVFTLNIAENARKNSQQ